MHMGGKAPVRWSHKDHHEGYLSWAEFEWNRRLIADNANSKGLIVRGSVRRGEMLLAGLLRCGHCRRKLHVGGTSGAWRRSLHLLWQLAGRPRCQRRGLEAAQTSWRGSP
jgi:hypothetical protein